MVIADSGFWVALANARDHHHERAQEALSSLADEPLAVTWPVVTEVCHLLAARLGGEAVDLFLGAHAKGGFTLVDVDLHPLGRIAELMAKYRDLPSDSVDGPSRLPSVSLEEPGTLREPAAAGPLTRSARPADLR